MLSRQLLFWALAWVSLASADAEPLLQLDAVPVWNGRYQAGTATEIQVRLTTKQGGTFVVDEGGLSVRLQLEPATPYGTSLPIHPDGSGVIYLEAFGLDDPTAMITRQMTLHPVGRGQIALVSDGLDSAEHRAVVQTLGNADEAIVTPVDARSLPRLVAGYEAVDGVALHFAGLKNMEDRQIQALTQYVMQCGKLIALAFPESIIERFKKISGCRGDFFITAHPPFHDLASINSMMAQHPAALPETWPVTERPGAIIHPNTLLVVFCLCYFVFGAAALALARRKATLFLFPLAMAALALTVWAGQKPEKLSTSWLEMHSGHTSARYAAHLTVIGTGSFRESLELPVTALAAHDLAVNHAALKTDTGNIVFPIESALLSTNEWHWQAAMQLEAPLAVTLKNGQPTVINHGMMSTDQGLLRWQNRIYILPALEPGQNWIVSPDTAKADNSELTVLFAKQSRNDATALLVPFTPTMASAGTKANGWLLIHAATRGV